MEKSAENKFPNAEDVARAPTTTQRQDATPRPQDTNPRGRDFGNVRAEWHGKHDGVLRDNELRGAPANLFAQSNLPAGVTPNSFKHRRTPSRSTSESRKYERIHPDQMVGGRPNNKSGVKRHRRKAGSRDRKAGRGKIKWAMYPIVQSCWCSVQEICVM